MQAKETRQTMKTTEYDWSGFSAMTKRLKAIMAKDKETPVPELVIRALMNHDDVTYESQHELDNNGKITGGKILLHYGSSGKRRAQELLSDEEVLRRR